MAQLKDLIVNGPSRFIGDVYATTFTGNLAGNASTATSATNAGTVGGLSVHSGRNNEANKIVRTDGNGYLQVGYINSSSGHEKNASSPTYVWGSNSSDSYLRSYQTSSLSVKYATTSGSCSGNAATATKATQDGNGNIITSTYLPLSGGTINGNLKIGAIDNTSYKYLVLFRSGHFARISNTEKDVFFAFGTVSNTGVMTAEKVLKIGDNGIQYSPNNSSYYDILHAGNLTSYAPSLTGSGATGTWGISISGNATNADKLDGYHASSFSLTSHTHSYIVTQGDNRSTATKPSDYRNRITFAGIKTNSIIGSPSSITYSYVVGLRGWSDTSGGKAHELAFNDNGIFHRIGATDTWEAWDQLETKGNTTGYLNAISKSGNTLTITPKGGTAFTFTNITYSRKWDDNLSNTDYPGYGDATSTDDSFSLVNVGDMKRWNKTSYMLEGLEDLLASI